MILYNDIENAPNLADVCCPDDDYLDSYQNSKKYSFIGYGYPIYERVEVKGVEKIKYWKTRNRNYRFYEKKGD